MLAKPAPLPGLGLLRLLLGLLVGLRLLLDPLLGAGNFPFMTLLVALPAVSWDRLTSPGTSGPQRWRPGMPRCAPSQALGWKRRPGRRIAPAFESIARESSTCRVVETTPS